jgi:probable RNA-binding protein EIF1AD
MAPPRRKLQATEAQTLTPPDELPAGHRIAKVLRATGNNIYSVELPSKDQILVVLPARFRSTIWMKRGSYVVLDMNALEPKDRLSGEIVNIVRDEKAWRKAQYW